MGGKVYRLAMYMYAMHNPTLAVRMLGSTRADIHGFGPTEINCSYPYPENESTGHTHSPGSRYVE